MDAGLLVALQQLAPVARAVFILRDRLGWDDRSVAELLGITSDCVDAAFRQARRELCESGHLNRHE
jgi:DNA-directed RNA polymerase specialized sigma24 family protein